MKKLIYLLPILSSTTFASPYSTYTNNDQNEPWVDQPEVFIGNKIITNLEALYNKAPHEYSLKPQPWSGSFWPTRRGGIGWRYAANPNDFGHFSWADYQKITWKDFYDYTYVKRPSNSYHYWQINNLSPAEKYDLLVGDRNFSLTQAAWKVGQIFGGLTAGDVNPWLGNCDGWSASALTLPRPTKPVTVKDYTGKDLIFYPSDIKALATQLWTNSISENDYRQMGGRCYEYHPKKDSNGRIIDSACRDINPGIWHIIVLNQIGIYHKGFVLDSASTAEIRNQPSVGYSIEYYNLQTGEISQDPKLVTISRNSYINDDYSSYRSDNTTSIVGVKMKFTYVKEKFPNHRNNDSKSDDKLETQIYNYDLELNQDGKIIGGEWHTDNHPDFIWTIRNGIKLHSDIDGTGNWDIREEIPSDWHSIAINSSKKSQPLASIVNALFDASQPNPQSNQLIFNGQCLNVYGGYTFNGALVLTNTCDGSKNQQWVFTNDGHLKPEHISDMCFENANIMPCDNSPEQIWTIDEKGIIKNKLGQQITFRGNNQRVLLTEKGSLWKSEPVSAKY
ncbi:TPA: ricin-type beta-trefoil lectin domain protein [Photobacterium damselae]|uniref:Peptidase n=1 Tax=Photobacterium damselae TaxID=38293 RepID=A0ABD6X6U9_PHODM|nr:ricin-type beta-trefoil lectin domain protein [Photobacterium damselae]MCG9777845.1 ricin-type beta-trefoil lectin domain protein [Photobacterium damselae]OBU46580.1 hypothetical protein AYY27_03060 [Photobacterium damselae]PSU17684.1 peptidase [Photobacterium damselae]